MHMSIVATALVSVHECIHVRTITCMLLVLCKWCLLHYEVSIIFTAVNIMHQCLTAMEGCLCRDGFCHFTYDVYIYLHVLLFLWSCYAVFSLCLRCTHVRTYIICIMQLSYGICMPAVFTNSVEVPVFISVTVYTRNSHRRVWLHCSVYLLCSHVSVCNFIWNGACILGHVYVPQFYRFDIGLHPTLVHISFEFSQIVNSCHMPDCFVYQPSLLAHTPAT